jgi:hypothetical protein
MLDTKFEWTREFEEAFERLKKIVGEQIVLKALDYRKDSGKITLAVDSSYLAAGAVLMQEDKEGKSRPVLYKSVTFSAKESNYAQ